MAATATAAAKQEELRKQTQEDCVKQSITAGAKAAAWVGATSGTAVFLANQYLPAFRSALGVSGKTALIVSRLLLSISMVSLVEIIEVIFNFGFDSYRCTDIISQWIYTCSFVFSASAVD